MKNVILYAIAMAFVFIACNSNNDNSKEGTPRETKAMDTTTNTKKINPMAEQFYACSMHPEVTGKKDETCSNCGMKLTVPVKNAENPK
jgi:hypothetical protein